MAIASPPFFKQVVLKEPLLLQERLLSIMVLYIISQAFEAFNYILTTILPLFLPSKSPMKASGRWSKPSIIVSVYLSLP